MKPVQYDIICMMQRLEGNGHVGVFCLELGSLTGIEPYKLQTLAQTHHSIGSESYDQIKADT